MNIKHDYTGGSHVADADSLTFPHTCSGHNRILLVGIQTGLSFGEEVQSVTYNGVPLTQIGSLYSISVTVVELWYLLSPPLGTHDVVVTLPEIVLAMCAVSNSYTGVSQRPVPYHNPTEGSGSVGNPSLTLGSGAKELVVDILGGVKLTEPTPGGGQTLRGSQAEVGTFTWRALMSEKEGAPSVDMSWSNMTYWVQIAVSLYSKKYPLPSAYRNE